MSTELFNSPHTFFPFVSVTSMNGNSSHELKGGGLRQKVPHHFHQSQRAEGPSSPEEVHLRRVKLKVDLPRNISRFEYMEREPF